MERIIERGGDALRANGLGITRIGHPARVLQSLVTSTLDYQSQNSSEGLLLKDVREELQASMKVLRPDRDAPAAGNKSTSYRGQASSRAGGKGRMSGSERRQRWDEVRALRKEYRKRERGLTKAVISRASIVVATCHGAGGRQLNNSVTCLYGSGCKSLLDVQYRMNQEIMTFPNEALYESQLKAHESNCSIRLFDLENYELARPETEEEEKDDVRLAPIIFIDTAGSDMFETSASALDDVDSIVGRESKTNVHEVELCPVSLLADRLSGFRDAASGERVEIGTVDGMQGRENEQSSFRSSEATRKELSVFLAEKRRLNVAMTRPKRQLCVIGDSTTCRDSGDEYLARWMDHLEENALVDLALLRNQ
ncbi:hypothetical protein L7F22_042363 [Adiantum nelumboides]|nr:hypothetical protein [Adiantum nelumboides]